MRNNDGMVFSDQARNDFSTLEAVPFPGGNSLGTSSNSLPGLAVRQQSPVVLEHVASSMLPEAAPLRDCGLRWYVENIATDFYSSYHRYTAGKPVNWRFVETKKAYREAPLDPRALFREPSLSDPLWQARIRDRLAETVRLHRADRPLFYDLVALGEERDVDGVAMFGVASAGEFYAMAPAAEIAEFQ